jgi:hypothetical protein
MELAWVHRGRIRTFPWRFLTGSKPVRCDPFWWRFSRLDETFRLPCSWLNSASITAFFLTARAGSVRPIRKVVTTLLDDLSGAFLADS